MKRELALEFARVTEAAALAAHKWVGRGKKESADQAGVDAMRTMLNRLAIDGEIVIGEGEIDEAPMLYIGEKVGLIYNEEEKDSATYVDPVDIAVDPVEGTRMTAQGQPNAITVLAVGKKGSFLKAPDMYMEKIIVGPEAKGKIDLSKPLEDNIHAVAKALNKELKDLMIVILDKPRHKELIKDLQAMGVKVYALPDGDVAEKIISSSFAKSSSFKISPTFNPCSSHLNFSNLDILSFSREAPLTSLLSFNLACISPPNALITAAEITPSGAPPIPTIKSQPLFSIQVAIA